MLRCVFICFVATLAACNRSAPLQEAKDPPFKQQLPAPGPKVDACTLLTREDVGATQHATITEAKGSEGLIGEFAASQCFYTSQEPDKSVNVTVMQRDPAHDSSRSIHDYWRETFGRFENTKRDDADRERKEEIQREQEKKGRGSASREESQQEEGARAIKIGGVGDDAFWTGMQMSGVLYVLRGEKILRVSVGGPGDEHEKLEKSKALASKALSRL